MATALRRCARSFLALSALLSLGTAGTGAVRALLIPGMLPVGRLRPGSDFISALAWSRSARAARTRASFSASVPEPGAAMFGELPGPLGPVGTARSAPVSPTFPAGPPESGAVAAAASPADRLGVRPVGTSPLGLVLGALLPELPAR